MTAVYVLSPMYSHAYVRFGTKTACQEAKEQLDRCCADKDAIVRVCYMSERAEYPHHWKQTQGNHPLNHPVSPKMKQNNHPMVITQSTKTGNCICVYVDIYA